MSFWKERICTLSRLVACSLVTVLFARLWLCACGLLICVVGSVFYAASGSFAFSICFSWQLQYLASLHDMCSIWMYLVAFLLGGAVLCVASHSTLCFGWVLCCGTCSTCSLFALCSGILGVVACALHRRFLSAGAGLCATSVCSQFHGGTADHVEQEILARGGCGRNMWSWATCIQDTFRCTWPNWMKQSLHTHQPPQPPVPP